LSTFWLRPSSLNFIISRLTRMPRIRWFVIWGPRWTASMRSRIRRASLAPRAGAKRSPTPRRSLHLLSARLPIDQIGGKSTNCAPFRRYPRTEAKLGPPTTGAAGRLERWPSGGLRQPFDMLASRKASRRLVGRPEAGGGVAAITQAASGPGVLIQPARLASRAVYRDSLPR
jgi:hypothetical protein